MSEHFGRRLRQVRELLGLSQMEMAKALGIHQTSLSSAEKGRNYLSTAVLVTLSKKFRVNVDYLLSGHGPVFLEQDEGVRSEIISGNAGHAITADHTINDSVIEIPGLGLLSLIQIVGESMEPFLLPGDYVGCTQLRSIRDIDPSKVYLVNTRDSGVYVKFVLLTDDRLILRSANPAYPDEQIPIQDGVSLYEVKVRITRHVVPVHDMAALQLRIKRIEDMLRRQHHDRKDL